MADGTKIEWTDASVNPVRARDPVTGKVGWHCEHKTPGCEFCYAETLNRRLGTGHDFTRQARERVELFLDDKTLMRPLHWRRGRTIFWHSMTDAFADFMRDDWLDRTFAVCALTPRHRHIFLTKRPDRMAAYFADRRVLAVYDACEHTSKAQWGHPSIGTGEWPLPNVLLGVSIEDQRRADERREAMLRLAVAGWKTIVSYEPALRPIDWRGWEFLAGLISGGESGRGARPSHPNWHRAARDFCQANGVSYFFKQWGEWAPVPDGADESYSAHRKRGGRDYCVWPDGISAELIGKSRAGRLLDGHEHSEMPA